jgi:hypothetical protein
MLSRAKTTITQSLASRLAAIAGVQLALDVA